MKYLIFIFTLCFIGRLIDVQGQTDTEPEDPDGPKHRKPEESTQESDPPLESDETEKDDDDSSAESDNNETGETDSGEMEGQQIKEEIMKLYLNELQQGETSDLFGQNQHIKQSNMYPDLGRRTESQSLKNNGAEKLDYLTPEKAPPELVLLVAKESRLLRAGKDNKLNDFDRDKLLRSGNYWDGVWKEEVNPKSMVRSATQEKRLGSIKAKINPGTEFYKVASRMKKISPKLIYIINKK